MISEFRGDYAWLSNFYPSKIYYDGYYFSCVECAYQSQKNNDVSWKLFCSEHDAKIVKRESKKINLIYNWDYIKFYIMLDCLNLKFRQEPFKSLLVATEDHELIEGNNWGDTYWGICNGKGKNTLGKMLMSIRNDLLLDNLF